MVQNFTRYVVVCKNSRQADLLFDRIAKYWDLLDSLNMPPKPIYQHRRITSPVSRLIRDPFYEVCVVTERTLLEFTESRAGVKCTLINGMRAGRNVDRRIKELENDRA